MDSVGMALSSRPLWLRTHRASSRFTWEAMSCAGTRGSVPGEKGPYFLESFFSMLVTKMYCGQNHGCQHFPGTVQKSWRVPTGVIWEPVKQKVPVTEKWEYSRKRICWLMAAIPAVNRLRQEDHHKLEVSLSYIMSSNPGWAQSNTLYQKRMARPTAAWSLRSQREALEMVYQITAGANQNSEHVCAGPLVFLP